MRISPPGGRGFNVLFYPTTRSLKLAALDIFSMRATRERIALVRVHVGTYVYVYV